VEQGARNDPSNQDRGGGSVLIGTIERVTFHSEETLYAVLRIRPERGYEPPPTRTVLFAQELATAVGKIDQPTAGLRLKLFGRWTEHRSHGQQFEFETSEVLSPASKSGIVKYLASDRFPGIGEKLAERIVEKLGVATFSEILEHPEKLDGIRGLRPPVKDALVAAVLAEYGTHKAQAFLRGQGLGPVQSAAVMRKLGSSAKSACARIRTGSRAGYRASGSRSRTASRATWVSRRTIRGACARRCCTC